MRSEAVIGIVALICLLVVGYVGIHKAHEAEYWRKQYDEVKHATMSVTLPSTKSGNLTVDLVYDQIQKFRCDNWTRIYGSHTAKFVYEQQCGGVVNNLMPLASASGSIIPSDWQPAYIDCRPQGNVSFIAWIMRSDGTKMDVDVCRAAWRKDLAKRQDKHFTSR
jgi:hypothetical protein